MRRGCAAAAPADDVQAPVVALVRPAVQFLSQALFSEMMRSARALSVAEQASSRAASLPPAPPPPAWRRRRCPPTPAHQPQHAMVGVHLDDAGVLGPVIQPVLRQGAEGPEPRAQRQHHVGLGQELHAGLGALVAQRAAPQRMARRKGVVVQIAGHHRCAQQLGQRHALGLPVREQHAAAGHDHREARLGQQPGRRLLPRRPDRDARGAARESPRRSRHRSSRAGCSAAPGRARPWRALSPWP